MLLKVFIFRKENQNDWNERTWIGNNRKKTHIEI